MGDVTPIGKTRRYRRVPRTEEEWHAYMMNVQRRLAFSMARCEASLPRVCTGRATEPHHVFPQRLGRDDSFDNLRAVCPSCNAQIESMGRDTAEALGLFSPVPLGP